jgi:hypothetical protein
MSISFSFCDVCQMQVDEDHNCYFGQVKDDDPSYRLWQESDLMLAYAAKVSDAIFLVVKEADRDGEEALPAMITLHHLLTDLFKEADRRLKRLHSAERQAREASAEKKEGE